MWKPSRVQLMNSPRSSAGGGEGDGVDQNVELAVLLFEGGEEGVDLGVVGDVALEALCAGQAGDDLVEDPPGDRNRAALGDLRGHRGVHAQIFQVGGDQPEFAAFERAWLQYCELYNASPEEQEKALGKRLSGVGLQQGHSRLTAYAAWRKKDPRLAARAWKEFAHDWMKPDLRLKHLEGPAVLNPVDEAAWVSTNEAAQWALAAIQNLALVPEARPG